MGIEQVLSLARTGSVKLIKILLVSELVELLVIRSDGWTCLQSAGPARAGGVNKSVREKHQSGDWFVR